MHSFNFVDLFIIGVIGLSVLISLVRGFVREALSLVSWALAIYVALSFASPLANQLQAYIAHPLIRLAVAFATLFIATLIVAGIINYLISLVISKTGLSGTDRMLGMIFGFGRGALLMSLLLLLGHLTPLPEAKSWRESMLVPNFLPMEQWLTRFLPNSITTKLTGLTPSTLDSTKHSSALHTEV